MDAADAAAAPLPLLRRAVDQPSAAAFYAHFAADWAPCAAIVYSR